MTEIRQIDLVSFARGTDLDLEIASEGASNGGSLALAQGDYVLKRDLDELIHTPMFRRLYEPFWGHRFDINAQAPDGSNVLLELRYEWRRLMEREPRVRATSARVRFDGTEYIFSVESALTGELVSVRMVAR
jgi:hypothetical protein